MNSLFGFIFSILYSFFHFGKLFQCRFSDVPNIRAKNFIISSDFFSGPGLYVRGNKYANIIIGSKVLLGPQVMILAGNHLSNYTKSHLFDYNEHDPNSNDILVNNGAWIGARTILLSGADVGEGTIVGCNSVVNKKLEPYCIYAGSPARLISPRFTYDELRVILENVESDLLIDDIPFKK